MNRKTLYWIIGICVFIAAILIAYFLFFSRKATPTATIPKETPSFGTPTTTLPISIPISSKNISTTTCSSGSSIEQDDCLLKKASVSKNIKDCTDIQSAFTKTYCTSVATSKVKTAEISLSAYAPAPVPAKIAVISATDQSTKANQALSNSFTNLSTTLRDSIFSITNDARTSYTGFLDRMANKAPLALFIVNPITSKVGERVTATGSGFLKSGNTVTIGSQTITDLEKKYIVNQISDIYFHTHSIFRSYFLSEILPPQEIK